MQVFKTTTRELDRREIDVQDLVSLEIKIGHTVYTLSDRNGQLRVSVEGQLVALPGGVNMIVLDRQL